MKSKEITPEIRQAIREWYTATGMSQEKMGEVTGINKSSINGWLNGDTKSIRGPHWERLFPHIAKYLPANIVNSIIGSNNHVFGNNNIKNSGNGKINVFGEGTNIDILIEDFRKRTLMGVIELDIDLEAKDKVLKLLKDIPSIDL